MNRKTLTITVNFYNIVTTYYWRVKNCKNIKSDMYKIPKSTIKTFYLKEE